jgi:hypothetical protein
MEDKYDEEMEDEYDSSSGPPLVAKQPRGEHYTPPTSLDVRFETRYLPSLNTILADRLGYRPFIPLPTFHTMPQMKRLLPQPAVEHALTALGVPSSLAGDLSEVERANVVDAVGTLLLAGKKVGELQYLYGRSQLPSRWDISPLALFADRPSLPKTLAAYGFALSDSWGTNIARCVLGRSETKLESQWWVLVVDTTTLVQICRAGLGEVRPIARYLIQQGIAFQIALLTHLGRRPTVCRVARQGAGSYTDDDPFTRDDYRRYEERLNAFLASRRGALALRYGGVIWRLAIESVNSQKISDTLEAPTDSSIKHGSVCGSALGYDLVADQLEPHEIDLILGAYRYRSRDRAQPKNWNPEATTTLWPSQAAWAKSSLNTGEWNRESEQWFQARRQELRDGLASPMSSTAWKVILRKRPETRRMWKNYDALVVDGYLSLSPSE